MNDLYHDFRTGGRTYAVIVFLGDDTSTFPEHGYSPEYFAANSEHVTLHGCRFCIDRKRITVARGTNTGWEGQS